MSIPKFLTLTTIGTLIWNTVLVNLGASVGENWGDIVAVMEVYANIAYTVIAVVGIAVLVWIFYFRPKKKAK